jgi:hypothetical protein
MVPAGVSVQAARHGGVNDLVVAVGAGVHARPDGVWSVPLLVTRSETKKDRGASVMRNAEQHRASPALLARVAIFVGM